MVETCEATASAISSASCHLSRKITDPMAVSTRRGMDPGICVIYKEPKFTDLSYMV